MKNVKYISKADKQGSQTEYKITKIQKMEI